MLGCARFAASKWVGACTCLQLMHHYELSWVDSWLYNGGVLSGKQAEGRLRGST